MGQAYNEKECFPSTHHPSIHPSIHLVWCVLVGVGSLEPPETPDLPPTLHIPFAKEISCLVRLVRTVEMTFV
jgi:hypothetical protein